MVRSEGTPAQEEASRSNLPALHSGNRNRWTVVSLKNISNEGKTRRTEALLMKAQSGLVVAADCSCEVVAAELVKPSLSSESA